MPVDDFPAVGYHAREEVRGGRVQAEAFFDAGHEEGEVAARFVELDGRGEVAQGGGGVNLGARAGEDARGGEHEAEDGAEGGAGCVGAGLDEEGDVGAFLGGGQGCTGGEAGVETAFVGGMISLLLLARRWERRGM